MMRRRYRDSNGKTAVEDDFRESAIKYVIETTELRRQKAKQKILLTSMAVISALLIVTPLLPKLLVSMSEQITEFLPASDPSKPTSVSEENICDSQSSTDECQKPQGLREKLDSFKENVRENSDQLKEAMDQS